MISPTNVEVSVAQMEVKVGHLERQVEEIKQDVKFIRQKLDQATGGWRILMLVGGAGAALMGLALKLLGLVRF